MKALSFYFFLSFFSSLSNLYCSSTLFSRISMFCALRNLTNCAILITNQMNMPLSRATEGTGPVKSDNLPKGKVPNPAVYTER